MLATRGFALDPNKDLDQYDCRAWTFQNGMPVTSVRAIAQTKDGYIWLGTLKGLVRFDGVGFTLVGVPPVSELRSTCVQALCPSSSGGLWFGLEKSAYGYHAPDGGWRVGSDPQAGWDWDGLSSWKPPGTLSGWAANAPPMVRRRPSSCRGSFRVKQI